MTFKLMVGRGLDCSAKLMPVDVKSLSSRAAGDLAASPRVDFTLDEHEPICVEEEEDFVQPVDDLCRLVRAGCFEITFLDGTEWRGIHQDADQALRSGNKRFFARAAERESRHRRCVREIQTWK